MRTAQPTLAADGEHRCPALTTLLPPLALALLAALVRLPTLAQQSIWLDEAYTERLVRMPFGSMLHAIPISESTPPVYYVLEWGWTHLVGYSEFGIRSLSALAGILTVPVVWALGSRLADRRTGAIAGALVALAPLMVWFSQEARSYALAALLSTVTLLSLTCFLDRGEPRWLGAWVVSSALGLATHYFVALIVIPELVWLLCRRRAERRVLAAAACVVAVLAALVPLALAQRGTGHADYISQGSLGTRLLQVPKQFLVGYTSPYQALTAVLAGSLVFVGVIQALVAFRTRPQRRGLMLPLTVGLACVVVPMLLALVGVDFLNSRNLLPALPALLVVVGIGLAASGSWRGSAVLAGGLCLVFLAVVTLVDTHPRYQRDNWRGVSRALGAPIRARAIVVSPGSGLIALQVYQPGLQALSHPASVSELDVVAIPARMTGEGIGLPPRPGGRLVVPPGFRLAGIRYASTYTVLRFRSAISVPMTAGTLARTHLGASSAILLQVPRSGA